MIPNSPIHNLDETPTMSMIWDEPYAFVSSSFRDMHAERDLCNLIVFPELEERLKAHRHYLLPVELR